MTNGFGAGFFAISLLAVLIGLALVAVLATLTAYWFHRETGRLPRLFHYLPNVIGVAVLASAGFGVLVLYDEAASLAALFASVALFPLLVVGGYLRRTSEASRREVVSTTVMVWGPTFLVGVVVVFGVTMGLQSVLGFAPGESRQFGLAWLAAGSGGLVIVVGMLLLGPRFGRLLGSGSASRAPD